MNYFLDSKYQTNIKPKIILIIKFNIFYQYILYNLSIQSFIVFFSSDFTKYKKCFQDYCSL